MEKPEIVGQARPVPRVAAGDPGQAEAAWQVATLTQTPCLISWYAADGRRVGCNPAAQAVFGEGGSTLAQRCLAATDNDLLLRALQSDEPRRLQLQVRTAQGDRWHELDIRRMTDPVSGAPLLQLSERDITELRHTAAELRSRDALFKAVRFGVCRLFKADTWQQDIQTVLAQLGEATQVSRIYLLQNQISSTGELLLHRCYEWPVVDDAATPATSRHLAVERIGFGHWQPALSHGEAVAGLVRDLPPAEQAWLQSQRIQSILLVPVLVDQSWWGSLGFDDCQSERLWSPAEIDVLAIAAEALGAAISREQAGQRLRQAAIVFDNTSEGIIITDGDANIVAVNPAFSAMTGYSEAEALGRNPRFLQSHRHDRAFFATLWEALRSTGQWQGEIWNRRKSGEVYPEWLTISRVDDATGAVSHYVAVFTDITLLKRSQQRLEQMAHHDYLTGLPNRFLFNAHLEQALQRACRRKSHLAVLFLDLDRFKTINDTLGHHIGDELLQTVASRLKTCVRKQDVVARLGGDEFTVVMEDLSYPRDAALVAHKILHTLAQPMTLGGHELFITTSIGISIYPRDSDKVGDLVRNADTAMYRAKEQGRNKYEFYTRQLTTVAFERLRLENDFRRALERGEFKLHYQPLFSVRSGRISGAEALVRWQHPDLGLLLPNRFMAIAEDTQLILPLENWVLETACNQCRAWQTAGLAAIQVAVNLSGQHVLHGNSLTTIQQILEHTGLEPRYLALECTEQFIMEQLPHATATLSALQTLGVVLSVDNFGAGCAFLRYLKRLSIQKLKCAVGEAPENINDRAIVRAVVALGHSLQMTVVVRGVETEAQRVFLEVEGCDEMQGYLLSQPVTAAAFAELLAKFG
jgi:diguanylate cyclase (GGDEF)-like protein/PAS domain S-box-containing protein